MPSGPPPQIFSTSSNPRPPTLEDLPDTGTLRWVLPLTRGRALEVRRPLVMGILNVTPDSFSDGGRLAGPGDAARAAVGMLAAGAGLLDVGGESTRPGAAAVPEAEELRRVVPAVEAIRRAAPGCVLSVDTRKPAVADAALQAGADMVNDVSGLADLGMADVVRRHGCAIVLMRSAPCRGGDVVAAARREMEAIVAQARAAGLPDGAILLDPGLGFGDPPGPSPAANLALLEAAGALGAGHPVVVGASRKRFIGRITGEPEPARRVGGSVAAAVRAVRSGAAVVRVHDVAGTVAALRRLQPVA